MKFCFGTIFSMLCQVKKSNEPRLYCFLIEPWDNYMDVNCSEVTKRKKGEDAVPKIKCECYINKDSNEIGSLYKKSLNKYVDDTKYKEIILSIKEILQLDDTIPLDTEIGSKSYTKKTILEKNTFDFYDLLVHVIKYCLYIRSGGYSSEDTYLNKNFVVKINK